MKYYQLSDCNSEMNDLRQKGRRKGLSIGFPWEVFPYTVKLGSTTYMGAAPRTGKTEIMKEIQINLSCLHGLNHVVFTPETGSVEDIFAEYCHSLMGKPYIKGNNSMNESEKAQAEMFINEHFIIVQSPEEDITVMEFYNIIDDIERDTGKKIHTTLIDPWNELREEWIQEDIGREDKYVSRILGMVRKNARRTNRHHFVVTHVRNQQPITKRGIVYFPMAHAREFSGGQSWFRKGNTMLIPWRPPVGLKDNANNEYMSNEVRIRVAKVKPKGVAKEGVYRLFLDDTRYQYYYFTPDMKLRYADRGDFTYVPPAEDVLQRMTAYQKTLAFAKAKIAEEIIAQADKDNFGSDEIPF